MIKVDISNLWGQVSLMDLLALEKETFDAHVTLSEHSGAGSEFLGWLDLPKTKPTLNQLIHAEKNLDREALILQAIENTEKITVKYDDEPYL